MAGSRTRRGGANRQGVAGRPGRSDFSGVFLATEEAVARAVDKLLNILMTGDANESKKAERILTRCFPGKWGEKYQLEERVEELEEQVETLENQRKGSHGYNG